MKFQNQAFFDEKSKFKYMLVNCQWLENVKSLGF